jgi:hypothetical protein
MPGLPVPVVAKIFNVFDGTDEYELECETTPARRAEILAACLDMVRTLRRASRTSGTA